jgi:hypothetical protein
MIYLFNKNAKSLCVADSTRVVKFPQSKQKFLTQKILGRVIALSIIWSFFLPNVLKSQALPGYLEVSTCFQTITDVNGKNIKLLKSNGQRSFKVRSAGGTGAVYGVMIDGLDPDDYFVSPNLGTTYELVRQSLLDSLDYPMVYWNFPQAADGSLVFTLDPSTVSNIVNITIIKEQLVFINGQPSGFRYVAQEFDIEFVDDEDIEMDIVPSNGKTCLRFDDYSFDLNFFGLEGLCVRPDYKLTSNNALNPGYLGLPLNWTSGEFTPTNGWPVIPVNCTSEPNGPECATVPNMPEPVPCKCVDFNLQIELYSCTGDYIDCPPILLNKLIKICCLCDVRPPNNNN